MRRLIPLLLLLLLVSCKNEPRGSMLIIKSGSYKGTIYWQMEKVGENNDMFYRLYKECTYSMKREEGDSYNLRFILTDQTTVLLEDGEIRDQVIDEKDTTVTIGEEPITLSVDVCDKKIELMEDT